MPELHRQGEIDRLRDAIDNSPSVLYSGRRGTGKTIVLKQFSREAEKNNRSVFYANITGTVNPETFITAVATQTLNVPEANQLKQLRELNNYFTYLRASVNYNRISGRQQLEFSLSENYKIAFTLEQLFTFLQRQSKDVIIMLDGFGQMMDYREPGFPKMLTEAIVQAGTPKLIFSGDESFRFRKWFNSFRKEFSGEITDLHSEEITHDEFSACLKEVFNRNHKVLTDDVADALLDWSRLHTATVYQVAGALLSSPVKKADEWILGNVIEESLKEQTGIFHTYRRLLTINQWMLLRGIAKEKGARQVMGGEFVRRYGLGSASSVQTALDALYEKEMVYESEGRLYLEDVMLSRWFESVD